MYFRLYVSGSHYGNLWVHLQNHRHTQPNMPAPARISLNKPQTQW